jgi:phage minor structural protein
MSHPILYSATETDFNNNGLGILGECVSCEVTEEANSIFELAMTYPMDGIHYEDIADRAIVKAKADQFRDPQLFRVYAISKPMSGIVTVLAEHISYDLSGIPVKPFAAPAASSALAGLKSNAVVDCPFNFWTDKSTQADFKVSVPSSIRSRLGGVSGSILDVYGGEYEFDNYTVKLHNSRGTNRGVSIRYGKNLTDIQQEQNCSNVATGVYPYWADSEGKNLVELPEKIIKTPGTYNFVKIRTVDFSQNFEVQPTVEQLRSKTENYIQANNIGIPKVSLSVSFAQLDQYEEYKHLKLLERVSLFDTVNVEFPALGVSATAKAVKMVYDVLADRVKSVTLGSIRSNIADTIANQQQEIQQAPTKSDLQKAKDAATAWLTNGKGYAYFRKDDLGNIVDILFMDTKDPSTAVNVMRVGQSGIGFSHNGVNGQYESAWTIDGNFVADWIKSGTLDANLINVINLIAENVLSTSGESSISVSGAELDMFYGDKRTVVINNAYGNAAQLAFTVYDDNGNLVQAGNYNAHQFEIGGAGASSRLMLSVNESGEASLYLPTDGKTRKISWQDNGDGTYTLIGS